MSIRKPCKNNCPQPATAETRSACQIASPRRDKVKMIRLMMTKIKIGYKGERVCFILTLISPEGIATL